MRGLLGGRRGEESGAKERENVVRSNCGNVEIGREGSGNLYNV